MRVFLWIALVGGCIGAVVGFFHFLSLQPDLPRVPAIVIVPQLIQAVLVAGFGVVAATVGAAGLAWLDAAQRQQATLDRIARLAEAAPPPPPPPVINRPLPAAPSAPQPSERAPSDPPRPRPAGHVPFGMKPCPSCGEHNWHDARTCTKCGTTFVLASPAQPTAPARQVCAACGEDSAAYVDRCPKCSTFFPLRPPPSNSQLD